MDSAALEYQALRSRTTVPAALQSASAQLTERLLQHPFLEECANGATSLNDLRNFLIQHGKYSRYFTRYLCALISQLEDGADVLRLAENLTEELGNGHDAETRIPHSRIYADMLQDFGIQIDQHPVYPETQNLIDTMFMLCRQPRGTAGLGAMCLGAEGLVPALYTRIIAGFRHHGIELVRLNFFSIHVGCDDEHAETMYEILARQIAASQSNRITAMHAGEIAVNARLRFFDALMQRVQ